MVVIKIRKVEKKAEICLFPRNDVHVSDFHKVMFVLCLSRLCMYEFRWCLWFWGNVSLTTDGEVWRRINRERKLLFFSRFLLTSTIACNLSV